MYRHRIQNSKLVLKSLWVLSLYYPSLCLAQHYGVPPKHVGVNKHCIVMCIASAYGINNVKINKVISSSSTVQFEQFVILETFSYPTWPSGNLTKLTPAFHVRWVIIKWWNKFPSNLPIVIISVSLLSTQATFLLILSSLRHHTVT